MPDERPIRALISAAAASSLRCMSTASLAAIFHLFFEAAPPPSALVPCESTSAPAAALVAPAALPHVLAVDAAAIVSALAQSLRALMNGNPKATAPFCPNANSCCAEVPLAADARTPCKEPTPNSSKSNASSSTSERFSSSTSAGAAGAAALRKG